MTKKGKEKSGESIQPKPLRLWPGVVAAVLLLVVRFGVLMVMPEAVVIAVFGAFICVLLIIVWWAFFSRAPRFYRWSSLVLMILMLIATWFIIHPSMRMMPFFAYIIPVMSVALVVGAAVGRSLAAPARRIVMVVALLLAGGVWALFQTGGVTGGEFKSDIAWRWAETPEERLLAEAGDEPTAVVFDAAVPETAPEWPGFRGPLRDGIVRGVRIETDWSASPPVKLWRRPVGPGWSSFAVHGDRFYTQEQRGDDEIVACYLLNTGEPVWLHRDAARFWESNGGAGPRGTPTLSEGRLYTLGGTGIVNALNAADGRVIWSRNAAEDTDTKVPAWGFSGSPLAIGDIVIVPVAGSLIAYDTATGDQSWSLPAGGDCYSSPHLLTIDGVEQILFKNEAGLISVLSSDGAKLWEHPWPGHPIVQPILTPNGDILLSVDERSGIRRITASRESGEWTVVEHWTSARLKPYFNDSVIRDGHVYGFDGPFLACIDGKDGARKWRGGRYGRGQFILLDDQGLLLVISEAGELALAEAVPDQFTELARFPAIEGKTWNHPVLVGDILLVRNAQEMAGFRLTLASERE